MSSVGTNWHRAEGHRQGGEGRETEIQTYALLLVLVFSWDILTIREIENNTGIML